MNVVVAPRPLAPRACFALLIIGAIVAPLRAAPATASGADIYRTHCAACHEQPSTNAPSRAVLQTMSSARILRTLDFGLMMGIAYTMQRDERDAVAKFLGNGAPDPSPPAASFCSAAQHPLSHPSAANWNGWSPSPTNARFQSADRAGLSPTDVSHLALKWALGYPGDVAAFGAPTILNGTVFVGSAGGLIQSLDAQTGCVFWTYQASGPVRSALVAAPDRGGYTLLFGDQTGWFYALDARNGKLRWKHRVDQHEATRITGSPVAQDGVVYVPAASWEETRAYDPKYECCTFRGSISALRVRDGSVAWKTYLVDPPQKTGVNSVGTPQWGPSGVGVWATPTIDTQRHLLYVATGDNYSLPSTANSDAIVALDLKTGHIAWTQQTVAGDAYTSACKNRGVNCPAQRGPDFDFGSSALLLRAPGGHDILVAGQKSGIVFAFDPDQQGKILWQTRIGKGGTNGGIEWGMAADASNVYAAVSDMAGITNLAGPVGAANLDAAQGGGLAALRLDDGAKLWFAVPHPCDPPRPGCSPAQPAAVTLIPGVVFSGSVDGHLRAFAAEDGKVLWDFDTARPFTTVNGVTAKGGSLDGAGPVIAGGMVFVNSGYPRNGGLPGNVLLAFAPARVVVP